MSDADKKGAFSEEIQQLQRLRDELRVQLNLAKKEVRDRYEATEKRWHELEGRLKVIGHESREALQPVEDATKLLVDEIRDAYRHIKDVI